jgi:hypothetical protein
MSAACVPALLPPQHPTTDAKQVFLVFYLLSTFFSQGLTHTKGSL